MGFRLYELNFDRFTAEYHILITLANIGMALMHFKMRVSL